MRHDQIATNKPGGGNVGDAAINDDAGIEQGAGAGLVRLGFFVVYAGLTNEVRTCVFKTNYYVFVLVKALVYIF